MNSKGVRFSQVTLPAMAPLDAGDSVKLMLPTVAPGATTIAVGVPGHPTHTLLNHWLTYADPAVALTWYAPGGSPTMVYWPFAPTAAVAMVTFPATAPTMLPSGAGAPPASTVPEIVPPWSRAKSIPAVVAP